MVQGRSPSPPLDFGIIYLMTSNLLTISQLLIKA